MLHQSKETPNAPFGCDPSMVLGPNQIEYHNRINMPWPAVDRDTVGIDKLSHNLVRKKVISEDLCNWKCLPINKEFVII